MKWKDIPSDDRVALVLLACVLVAVILFGAHATQQTLKIHELEYKIEQLEGSE